MSTTVSGTLSTVTKNTMLNGWRTATTYAIVATNNAGDLRSNKVSISFNTASNGQITLSSTVSLTIDSGSTGANSIKKLFVEPTANDTEQIGFEITDAIEFPDGGSLIINSLNVTLSDPS